MMGAIGYHMGGATLLRHIVGFPGAHYKTSTRTAQQPVYQRSVSNIDQDPSIQCIKVL
jgi:hypothetical protein